MRQVCENLRKEQAGGGIFIPAGNEPSGCVSIHLANAARVKDPAACRGVFDCGGEISYVMALRMGGETPHLGLILTKGSLGGYSVERDLSRAALTGVMLSYIPHRQY